MEGAGAVWALEAAVAAAGRWVVAVPLCAVR